MMKRRNIVATFVTLGLAAAATTPAMALENEFHGLFSLRYINSNFNRTATTDFGPGDGSYDPSGTTKKQYSANFFEQRARLQYIAKANADLKLVTHFEIDYAYWGNSSYTTGRNQGGAQGADTVNIETKSVYLDFNPCNFINVKMGMQPIADSFKGSIIDSDAAGVLLTGNNFGKFTPSMGYFRFNDTGKRDNVLGHLTSDMLLLDGKYEVSKDLKIGGAYYFFRDGQETGTSFTTTASNAANGVLPDGTLVYPAGTTFATTATSNRNDIKLHVFGLNAEYTAGPLTLNGFAIYETGWFNNDYVNSFAGNLGAKLKAGPGTARMEMLYVSGGSRSAFYSSPGGEHGYYDNEMVILGRDKNAYTTDNSMLDLTGNRGQGQMGVYLGYDLPVTPKLDTAFNVGVAGVTHSTSRKPINIVSGTKNGSNFLGTEVNAEATYKLLEGLSVSFRTAYVFLGGYYKDVALNGTPDDPYDLKLIFKYTF
ncbi:MAG: hypothetical protein HXX11_02235 [Desulfuromonadales bacterium]|nr:hypothetical protein [Desulfuromonadales bacterium]